jgi:natural product biosynthesis luciferase-like monooxygenase protein
MQDADTPRMSTTDAPAIEDSYPLTPLQHGMLLHALGGASPGVDVEQMVGELNERQDAVAFRLAWGVVAARHAILRTRLSWVGGEPIQEVLREIETPFRLEDLRDRVRENAQAGEEAIRAYLAEDRARGFDLATAPLWRVTLFRLGDERWRVVWTYSHVLLDNAFAFVLDEVELAYEAALAGRGARFEERRPYREHCVWLARHLEETREAAGSFFRGMLRGFETPIHLAALARTAPQSAETAGTGAGYATKAFRLSRAASDALRGLKADGVGVSVVVEAAWALVLSAFEGTDDVVFGVTRNCRRSSVEGAEAMVGLFINTLPVRARIEPAAPLLDWLRELRAKQKALRPFEHTALADALAASDVPHGTPLFETLVVYNDAHIDARMKAYGGRWVTRSLDLHDQVMFPCSLMGYGDEEIYFRLEYDPRRFDDAAMGRVASLTRSILEAIARDPRVLVGDLPRLPEEDTRRALSEWQGTTMPVPGDPCVHRQIEAEVARSMDATAVVFRDASLSYAALEARANRVARRLRGMGVGRGTIVGVFVERSLEMVVGLLGILKAGGAYAPLDPALPVERVAMMLEDTHAPVVLTLSRLLGSLPPSGAHVVALDALDDDGDASPIDAPVGGEDLAYVIFTSGSTGRPKGVRVRHRNVTNFFAGMDRAIGTSPGVWLALTSISFDISVLEIFWTLARGFKVIVQEDLIRSRREGPTLGAKARARRIDFSLFYFAAEARERSRGAYHLLLEGAKFADSHGFAAVWTPERHFHAFGGLYPNPAVTSAAVAVVTERIALRAGSVVLPLHNPLRCAEEWSVVDNLSNGRVGLSFASGWHSADFALMPQNFHDRRRLMAEGIETLRKLWRGEAVPAKSGDGKDIEVRIFPLPVQKEPPIWITASSSPDTFAMAGGMGANVLTNLLVMSRAELATNIALYRESFKASGRPGEGHVSLMLHTMVGSDEGELRETVRGPFLEYLRTSTDLINKARWELTAFAKPQLQHDATNGARDLAELTSEEMDAIMTHALERYYTTAGLFGTPRSCLAKVDELRDIGVDEIACLIDFGVRTDTVLASLRHLDALRALSNAVVEKETADQEFTIDAQVKRHRVTHLQCTPSLATLIASEPEGLSALGSLDTLLLGGEALPQALVDRIRPVVRGRILNMYGPTETTIWSTFAEVSEAQGAPITIGKPIANTRVWIVDRRGRPTPVGVPGELLIGGEGVALGYLNRPLLTEERFVPDALSQGENGRVYRTGDLARWREDGTLEFLGRLDQQVKIRGYRVELGEIESVLGRHPAVREAVVVVRSDDAGDPRLVAYVRPSGGGGPLDAGDDAITLDWQRIWEQTYAGTEGAELDATFNTAGWTSSYTLGAMTEDEMRAWVAETTSRIEGLRPRRLLEIGCGTGLLLLRLARTCERYVGVDISRAALQKLEQALDAAPAARGLADVVTLRELEADAIDRLAGECFDTVVLNSVAQYFPNVDYFVRVVEKAFALLDPGGKMFVGDVRSLPLLSAFHHSVELYRAPDALPLSELSSRIQRRVAQERELVLDPLLFLALRKAVPGLAGVELRLKDDGHTNELTRFRYDVVLTKSGGPGDAAVEADAVEAPGPCTIEALRALLRDEPPAVRIVGVPNARIRDDVRAIDLFARRVSGETAGQLRSTVRVLPAKGVLPSAVLGLHPAYEVSTTWSAVGADRFDLIARHRTKCPRAVVVAPVDASEARPWSSYANAPARPIERGSLASELRAHLYDRLPSYMLPSAFVVLEKLPLTPNGKIDRTALPAPDRARVESTAARVAPQNDMESVIVRIWQDMLSMDCVGADENVFDLGANSLMMVQANGRLRVALGRSVSVVDQFRFPTVRALAAHLLDSGPGPVEALRQSQDRAHARKEAMSRQREVRAGMHAKG